MPNGIKIASESILREIKRRGSLIEAPAHIAGVSRFDVGRFGAFSFCRGGSFSKVDSIGRFCSLAPNITIGPEEHKTSVLTTSTFLNSDAWESDDLRSYIDRNKDNRNDFLKEIRSTTTRNQKRVTIGNDVWIGQGAIIRRGVTIGDGAVIGAHSVISEDVRPYEVVSGVPAKHIRFRFDEETVARLVSSKWWEWSLSSLDGISWSDPKKAALELERRKETGLLKAAVYEVL